MRKVLRSSNIIKREMDNKITLEYEKIDPLTTREINPMVEYAKGAPDVFLYKVRFTFYGHNGVMLTLFSKVVVEDSYIDLREMLMNQVLNYVDDNPPQGLQMDFLVYFLELLNTAVPPAKEGNHLAPEHNINLVDNEAIEVNLYPAEGGVYHIPVKVVGKSAQEVVAEVRQKLDRILLIR